MPGNLATPGASVASRVLAVLGAFDTTHRALTLSELAARTGLPLTTTHRLVGSLVAGGGLSRTASGTYVVGRRLWDIGLLAPVQSDLVEVASPYLHDLYAATGATVHLAVRDHLSALYLARVRGNSSVPVVSAVGSRLPLHATGVGKVLLAHAPRDLQRQVLGSLERVTAYTVTQPGRLRRQLARVVVEGHAVTVEEMSLGACSVAVPVRGLHEEDVVAAVGVVVASLERDQQRLVAALQVTSRAIGRAMG